MSRILRSALGALAALMPSACAVIEPPSGGPEDKDPPQLLTSRPDTFAVVPRWNAPVTLVFDERVSERGIQQAVDVSPRTSAVVADHKGDQIRVSLRQGWQPGLIYHVVVLPGIQDLFNNPLGEPVQLVFSTGPAIPDTWAAGEVRDPITGQPEREARVEAIRRADSLVYSVPSDSAGRFRFSHLPEGEYQMRAYRDMNRNRQLDAFEPRDSMLATVTSGDTARARLGILLPDTTPPVITRSRLAGSTVELEFDDYLDPDQVLPPGRIMIVSTQGAILPVDRITVGRDAGGAAGGAAGTPATPETPEKPGTPAAPSTPGREGRAPADTARTRLPSQTLVVELAKDARPEPGASYRITLRNIRNVRGLSSDVETVLEVPAGSAPPPGTPADPTGR